MENFCAAKIVSGDSEFSNKMNQLAHVVRLDWQLRTGERTPAAK